MGVKVDFAQVVKDMPLATKQEIFPNYNNNDEQFIKVNQSGVCSNSVEVIYDTNFAVIAAETAKLKEIAALAGSIVDERNIVINKKNILATTNDLVDLIFEEKLESGLQEFKFNVEPCTLPPVNGEPQSDKTVQHCYKVVLDVSYVTVVTDFEDKTDDELAELMVSLEAGPATSVKGYIKDKKKRKGLTSGVLSIQTAIFAVDRPFEVRGQLIENAITDGELGDDSVSGVRINNVKFTVFSVPCPLPLLEDTFGDDQQSIEDGKLDLEKVEDIGEKTAAKLKQNGINDLKELATVDTSKLKIDGVSQSRLEEFKMMAIAFLEQS